MATWLILLIIFVAAGGLGSLGGVIIGKIMVKRAKSENAPVLTKKERAVYAASIVLGIALILAGVFYEFPSRDMAGGQDGMAYDGGAPDRGDFAAVEEDIIAKG